MMGATFVKVLKEKNFTIIDNGIFKDTGLSMKAKGLLTTMLSLPDDWDFSTLGLTTLFSDGDTAVRGALKELEQNGYLKREAIREKGVIVDWKYIIYEERQSEDFSKKPDDSSPDVENHHVGDRQQLNTNKSSTNNINNIVSTNVDTSPTEGGSVSDTETISHVSMNRTEGSPIYKYNRAPQKILTNEKPKKKNLWEKCTDEINRRYTDTTLHVMLVEYLEYRIHSRQHPMGFAGWVGLLNKLDVLGKTDEEKCKIIEQSIKMKWDTFAELKTWGKGSSRYSGTDVFAEGGMVHSIPADRSNFMGGMVF